MAQELNWSTFTREPATVEPLLEQGDVLLRRRDGLILRLSRNLDDKKGDEAIAGAALATVARLLAPAALAEDVESRVEQDAQKRLPWTRFLTANDRHTFVHEFLLQFEACADLGDFAPLGRLLEQWKATASLHAEGLAGELKRPIEDVGQLVPRPRR